MNEEFLALPCARHLFVIVQQWVEVLPIQQSLKFWRRVALCLSQGPRVQCCTSEAMHAALWKAQTGIKDFVRG